MFALAPQTFPSNRSGDIDRYDASATDVMFTQPTHTSCNCDLKIKREALIEIIKHELQVEPVSELPMVFVNTLLSQLRLGQGPPLEADGSLIGL